MADIVTWATGAELLAILASQSSLVSGMTVAEAAAALGFTKTASGLFVKTLITSQATLATGATASAAAGEITAVTTTAANLTLYETAGGTAAVGGLGSIALPIAASLVAAVGGYLVGNEIYEQNSEFLDNLMFPLYDFITGNNIADTLNDVPTVPVIINTEGQAYINSEFHYNVKSFLDSEFLKPTTYEISDSTGCFQYAPIYKIKTVAGSVINILSFRTSTGELVQYYVKILTGNPDLMLIYKQTNPLSSWLFRCMSNAPFTLKYGYSASDINISVTVVTKSSGGTTWYQSGNSFSLFTGYNNLINGVAPNYEPATGLETILQNKALYLGVGSKIGGFPDAITKYIPGTSPSPLELPDSPAWHPVVLPITVPGIMPNPQPIPEEYPEPDPEKITPFIPSTQPQPDGIPIKKPSTVPDTPLVPLPNPIPDISTEPSPAPNPETNPSVQPAVPSTPEVPVVTPTPTDTGSTPTPELPVIPNLSSAATGLLHVYNPTNAQINAFGTWLWTTFSGDLIDTLSKLFNNPMDAVIGLHEIYCTPIVSGPTTIKAGYLDSNVASQLVSARYTEINCGAVGIPEHWNNYLDYSPYTKVYCYLPFIGIVELNTDDVIGCGVEISYKIDLYNGSCIAMITTAKPNSDESVSYQFPGNCSVEIPITSGMKSAMQNALLGAASTALAVSVGAGAGVVAAAVVGGARQASSSKNLVQRSGSFGSSYGAMGLKKPYIIVMRPMQKDVPGYNINYGYPAHKMVLTSTCTGYLKAIEVDVVSPTATEEEKKMIETLLKSGIFVD